MNFPTRPLASIEHVRPLCWRVEIRSVGELLDAVAQRLALVLEFGDVRTVVEAIGVVLRWSPREDPVQ